LYEGKEGRLEGRNVRNANPFCRRCQTQKARSGTFARLVTIRRKMNCPNCGASSNNFGVWQGAGTVRCTRCGFDYNSKGEMSFRQFYNEDEPLKKEKRNLLWKLLIKI
jgi:DNA-directed RNA polymerase subunit RPC12/RpoP